MKLVAKYTLVLAAALAVALSILAVYRVENDRTQFERDIEADHLAIGRVLRSTLVDVLTEGSPELAETRTRRLIDRANSDRLSQRFEWIPGPSGEEAQRVEDRDFVSRFSVQVGGKAVGTVVIRESLEHLDKLVDTDILLSAVSVGIIVVFGLAASLVLGRWLVGRPIGLLVAQARRIAERDFSGTVAFARRDELGELAVEMSAMSGQLSLALATIAAETEARIQAVAQLRHADRLSTVGKLAAGIAHELGTPLSVVSGHAQMIAEGEVTGPAALESARAIDREAMRISRIVRQLLDFARRKGPEGKLSDPTAIAHRCCDLLRPTLERAAVRYRIDATTSARALIDEDSLQQVLTNLIVNASHAMVGGGELTIAVSAVHASSPDAPPGPPKACICIAVSDTGPGISPEVRAHLFEPFFTTKAPGEGTGLGLAVVYGIVVDHGGWITVDTSDRGTTFSVYLPEESA